MKPCIKKLAPQYYICQGGELSVTRSGSSPEEAYSNWEKGVTACKELLRGKKEVDEFLDKQIKELWRLSRPRTFWQYIKDIFK